MGAVKKREQTHQTFALVGAALESNQLAHLQSSLATFRSSLEAFAYQHKHAIASEPVFRAQFHAMCLSIGVDPLACHKGFWSQLLGLGDFYFELGVQIMDVCWKERASNGGLMRVDDVLKALERKYKKQAEGGGSGGGGQRITLDDIAQSVSKLACLGSGFVLLPIGGPKDPGAHLLKSVPLEMNTDHLALMTFASTPTPAAATSTGAASSSASSLQAHLHHAAEKGCVTPSEVARKLGWSVERINRCIALLLEEGMVWVDAQGEETAYWFPSLAMQ